MKRFLLVLCILLAPYTNFGSVGGMDRSKHAYLCNDGPDVCGDQCACVRRPCNRTCRKAEQYRQSRKGCYTGQPVCCKPIDYKTMHYVYCSCPCGSGPIYQILDKRGKCLECWHYHDPADFDLSAYFVKRIKNGTTESGLSDSELICSDNKKSAISGKSDGA